MNGPINISSAQVYVINVEPSMSMSGRDLVHDCVCVYIVYICLGDYVNKAREILFV